ncbi:MAG: helix-turn-helix transcriptional regulator [Prevotella sp.]|nr:helix-turn-helix transcriptional regulator [Prevotella sp.]
MKDEDLLRLIGKNAQRYRKRLGLTQEKLAAKVGFHSTYIGMIERAERKISVVAAYKLANALGVTLNDLITTEYE